MTTRPRRLPGVVGALGAFGLAAAAVALVGGDAMAGTAPAAVYRQPNGIVVVTSQRLAVLYRGHLMSQARLGQLNREHRAMFYAGDVPSAVRSYAHAFDTLAELDAYSRQLLSHQLTAQPTHS